MQLSFLCNKYDTIKFFNLQYFLTKKSEGMISVSVLVLDIHIILLDPMLFLSAMVIISLQGMSLEVF